MRWLKRDRWKAGIALTGILLLLVLMVWVPVSAAGTYEEVSGLAATVTGTVQATPTEDATVTALDKEKLAQEIDQLKNQNYWAWTTIGPILVGFAGILAALYSFITWIRNRQDEQKKRGEEQKRWLEDRKDEREKRAEERFQTVATGLGSERKEARIAAATILRTFLRAEYHQFHRQAFDLAVAYLQPLGIDTVKTDFVPLDPLRQALIVVFKESLRRVRGEWKEQKLESDSSDLDRLGAVGILLDDAYLVEADLRGVWMREALLRKAHLSRTDFTRAHLKGANFTEAYLGKAILVGTTSSRAIFTGAKLMKADFTRADLSRADFTGADFTGADFTGADLTGANLSGVRNLEYASLKGTNLHEVKGLAKEQLEFYKKEKGAIDEVPTNSSPPTLSQSNDVQAPSAPPAQVNTPTPGTDGSSATSSSQSGP